MAEARRIDDGPADRQSQFTGFGFSPVAPADNDQALMEVVQVRLTWIADMGAEYEDSSRRDRHVLIVCVLTD
jgi:hypothetical protein